MARFTITYGQAGYWAIQVWPKDQKKGLRYGQSWFNYFSEFQENSDEPFPQLFYETDRKKAEQIIHENTQYLIA